MEGGYYADPEAECQAFHICGGGVEGSLIQYSFLCPNGSLFNQEYFVCDWWFNVDCSLAEDFYSLNDEIAAEREANSPGGLGQYGAPKRGNDKNRRAQRPDSFSAAASSLNTEYAPPAGDGYSAPDEYQLPAGPTRHRSGRRGGRHFTGK